ncbi:D-glycero-D-manno-heptose 1,7 bisphosphate phosphatase [Desmospora sp. 8437]|nr:D-glycero-D-manno-heptose 1,7 bisphosphate phosphatase [Desmospora sp. 8437]
MPVFRMIILSKDDSIKRAKKKRLHLLNLGINPVRKPSGGIFNSTMPLMLANFVK